MSSAKSCKKSSKWSDDDSDEDKKPRASKVRSKSFDVSDDSDNEHNSYINKLQGKGKVKSNSKAISKKYYGSDSEDDMREKECPHCNISMCHSEYLIHIEYRCPYCRMDLCYSEYLKHKTRHEELAIRLPQQISRLDISANSLSLVPLPQSAHVVQSAPPVQKEVKNDITAKDINEEKDVEDPKNQCIVCMNREVKCIFMPCMHACCCLKCSSKVENCPNCRQVIESKKKFFLSSN
jgi:hypothetical protein